MRWELLTNPQLQVGNVLVSVDALRVQILFSCRGFLLSLLSAFLNSLQTRSSLVVQVVEVLNENVGRQGEVRFGIQANLCCC